MDAERVLDFYKAVLKESVRVARLKEGGGKARVQPWRRSRR